MSSFKNRSDYFKNIAYMSKLIAHNRIIAPGSTKVRASFHRVNNQEQFDAAVVNWAHYPCVVHMGHDLRFRQPKTGMPRRITTNALRFLAKVDRATYKLDSDAIEAAYDLAAEAMFQYAAYMIEDYETKSACNTELFIFDLNRASAEQTGLVADGVYGWDFYFDDEDKERGMIYNAGDWFDGTENAVEDPGAGGINYPNGVPEVISYSATDLSKTIVLTPSRIARFGITPTIEVWYTEASELRLNTNPIITPDALPPDTANYFITLSAPGPGVIVIRP